ncbi:hypothetical protein KSF73_06085 [Burkholderiaceae bacterium DAT-1]|nr:hypothetical protein [Burkholderiaceae bacterium DAT-1]
MKRSIGLLLMMGALAGCVGKGGSTSATNPQPTPALTSATNCDPFGEFVDGELSYNNDAWGLSNLLPGQTYSQCVIRSVTPQNRYQYSFNWNWPTNPKAAGIFAYPNVMYGLNPNWHGHASSTSKLPLQVSQLKGLTASAEVNLTSTGSYDLAYDLFFTTHASDTENNVIKSEIMVWLDYKNMNPAWWPSVGQVTIGNMLFDVYASTTFQAQTTPPSSPRAFIVFAPHQIPVYAGTIDLKAMIDYCVQRGLIDPANYLSMVSLGAEIATQDGGFGQMTINQFAVNIK